MNKIIVFDFETGGVESHHPNIQLAAIAVDEKWNEVDSFESKISFDPSLCDPEALAINHYTAEAWKGSRFQADVFTSFSRWLKKHATQEMTSRRTGGKYTVARLAAYNANFDKDRLWAMSNGQFVAADPRVLCVMQLAMWHALKLGAHLESFQLSKFAEAVGVKADGAHDALSDVRITAAVARKVLT